MPIQIKFITEKNKIQYLKKVLIWLKDDFTNQGNPEGHFWHNSDEIYNAFNQKDALVAVNEKDEIVGYMVWTVYENVRIQIDIVEVIKRYRLQGVFKNMLSDLKENFPNICIFSADPMPQAVQVFINLDWKSKDKKKYYQPQKQSLTPSDTLPDGCVIAIYSKEDLKNTDEDFEDLDYYMIRKNIDKYPMKYFQINLTEDKLHAPIIVPFDEDGYIGLYLNKKFIVDGKAKHLFEQTTAFPQYNLLIINKIIPKADHTKHFRAWLSDIANEDSKSHGKLDKLYDIEKNPTQPNSVAAPSPLPQPAQLNNTKTQKTSQPQSQRLFQHNPKKQKINNGDIETSQLSNEEGAQLKGVNTK